MYFLVREEDGLEFYNTIHSCDEEKFYELSQNFTRKLADGERVPTSNNFRIIKDKAEIKQILEDRYSSKNRTSEYATGIPSATLISSALFPKDIDKDFNIINWQNSVSVEDFKTQQITNKLSTDSGTVIHRVIELALIDNDRVYNKKRNLDKYIEQALSDKEIINMINNFEDRKLYFKEICQKTLKKFFEERIENIDPIFSEIFIRNKYLQGCVDCLCYDKNKNLTLMDWKTSKKSQSRTAIHHKYARQLYIYKQMLLRDGIISKKEYDDMRFAVGFFNWNSCNSAVYEYSKEEIDSSRNYVNFILSWYWNMKNDSNEKIEL